MLMPVGIQRSSWQRGTALPMAGTAAAAKQTQATLQ